MIEYLEIFKGDDSDFSLNQRISIKLLCDYDLSGMTAEVQVYDYIQTYNPIPANKRLPLVFPAAVTKKFPLGRCMAKIRLFDKDGKRRTIENKLGVIITNSIDCLSRQDINYTMMLEVSYDDLQDKPKIGDVTIEGAHDPHYYGLATKDDILSGAKALLPSWLTPDYVEPATVASVETKVNRSGDTMTGKLIVSAGTGSGAGFRAQLNNSNWAELTAFNILVKSGSTNPTRILSFPDTSGTFALTSDIADPVEVIDPASATEAGKAADALATKNALDGMITADYVTDFVQQSAILQARIKSVAQSLIRTAFANFDPNEQSFADLVNILKNIGA